MQNTPYSFCIPADFSLDTIKKLTELNQKYAHRATISETYGSIPGFSFPSGRKNSVLQNVSTEHFFQYIKELKVSGIDFSYTLNSLTLNNLEYTKKGYNQIIDTCDELIQGGVNSFIVSIPPLMEILKIKFPHIKLTASAVLKIDSLYKVKESYELGASRIVLFEDKTRDFKLIEEIINYGFVDIEIIINQDCLYGCISRDYHRATSALFNNESFNNDIDVWIPKCKAIKLKDPTELLKTPTLIRPEDICQYAKKGVKYFKIVGRESYWKNLLNIIEMYLKGENKGNFFDIVPQVNPAKAPFTLENSKLEGFIDFFVQGKQPCTNACTQKCNYCSSMASKLITTYSPIDIQKIRQPIDTYLQAGPSLPFERLLPLVVIPESHPKASYFFQLTKDLYFDCLQKNFVTEKDVQKLAIKNGSPVKSPSENNYAPPAGHQSFEQLVYDPYFKIGDYLLKHLKLTQKVRRSFFNINNFSNNDLIYNEKILYFTAKADDLDSLKNILYKFTQQIIPALDTVKEIKPLLTLENFQHKSLNSDLIIILKKYNFLLIIKNSLITENNLQLFNFLTREKIEVRIHVEVSEQPDFNKLFPHTSSPEMLINFINLSWKNSLFNKNRIDFLPYQIEVFHHYFLKYGIFFIDSCENLPFAEAFSRSFYRYSPLYPLEHNPQQIYSKLKTCCGLCALLPLCRGHYLLPSSLDQSSNSDSDHNLSLQKQICKNVALCFKQEILMYLKILQKR